MTIGDMPEVRHSTYTAAAYNPLDAQANGIVGGIAYLNQQSSLPSDARAANLIFRGVSPAAALRGAPTPNAQKEKPMATARRLVQVIIVDPDPNVPIDDCMLYHGPMHLTELDDQELFFEVDIKAKLAEHNAKRVKLIDKRVKDRAQQLEPARIRDLRMQIVTVATF